MTDKIPRNIFRNVNRFQDRILMPFYASCVIALFAFVLWTLSNNPFIQNTQGFRSIISWKISAIKIFAISSWLLIVVLFLLLVYWAYYVSNKILGGYERVLKELDRVIDDKHHGPIRVREGDDMFAEVLKRVNIIIERRRDQEERLIQTHAEEQLKPQKIRQARRAEDI